MQTYLDKTLSTSNEFSAIEVSDVTVNYGKYTALKDINFQLGKGSLLYVVGPNGSGKTTLIKLLVGLIKPSFGKVTVNSNSIGYLPQKLNFGNMFPITVREVIYSGFKKQSLHISDEDRALITEWLGKMEISHLIDKPMSVLSGGEQQRVYLIRALINNPDILVMDEPTSALDPKFRRHFNELVNKLHEDGVTIVYVTHDLYDKVSENAKVVYIDQTIKFFGHYHEFLEKNRGEVNV